MKETDVDAFGVAGPAFRPEPVAVADATPDAGCQVGSSPAIPALGSADLLWIAATGGGFLLVSLLLGGLCLLTAAGSSAAMAGLVASHLPGGSLWSSLLGDLTGSVGPLRAGLAFAAFGWTSHVGVSDGALTSGGLTLPQSAVTVLGAAAMGGLGYLATRLFQPTSSATLWLRLAGALAVCAVVLIGLAAIGRLRVDDTVLTFVSPGSGLRALSVVGLALLCGALATVPAGHRLRAGFGRHADRINGLGPPLTTAGWHAAAWVAIATLVTFATLLKAGVPLVLAANWAPAGVFAVPTLAHLGGLRLTVSDLSYLTDGPTSWTVALGDPRLPMVSWLLPIVAALAVVVATVRLAALLGPSRFDPRRLPATIGGYGCVWLLLYCCFGRASAQLMAPVEVQATVAPTGWGTVLMLVLLGVIVAAGHPLVGGQVVPRLPGFAGFLASGRLHPGWYQERPATAGESAQTATSFGAPFAPATTIVTAAGANGAFPITAPPGALDPAARRLTVQLSIVAIALVTIVIAGVIALKTVDARLNGPQATVSRFTDALIAGDAERAVELGRVNVDDDHRLLLTNEIYQQATGRPTEARVTTLSTHGDQAVVTVEIMQDGKHEELTLDLRRTRHVAGVWSTWELTGVPLEEVAISSPVMGVVVNGHDVDLSNVYGSTEFFATATVPALPGTYAMAVATSGPYFTSPVKAVTVTAGSGSSVSLQATPTEAFWTKAQAGVNAMLTDCLVNHRKECPTGKLTGDPAKWTVVEYPRLGKNPSTAPAPNSLGPLDLSSEGIIKYTGSVEELGPFEWTGHRSLALIGWQVDTRNEDVVVSFTR